MPTTITIHMRDSHVTTIDQIRAFIKLDQDFSFKVETKHSKYAWIEEVLRKFKYHSLKTKKEKSIVCAYIKKVTGMSKAQLKRLIKKHNQTGQLIPNYTKNKKNGWHIKYCPVDIKLLIETDAAHNHLSGQATKSILEREYEIFDRSEYKTISDISQAHIYNIRNHNRQYNSSKAKWVKRTQAVQVNIGVRAKPKPQGKPGYLRVDTVHSGDLNGVKGIYHINLVDEVTQFEMVATVEKISEKYLAPVIAELLDLFPFKIYEFHSDNGSEFINHVVAELLTKLYIKLTKSRARYSNDNALVESKNGSVIRKIYGHNHIPTRHAPLINEFNKKYLNIYLNYHRPCGFAEACTDRRGKVKKKYAHWVTPYEKLKSLENAKQYLKDGITFAQLDKLAYEMSDKQFATKMTKAKVDLFKEISKS